MKPAGLCRNNGILEATCYNWTAKYAGITVANAQQLKELAKENSRFRLLLAAPMLDYPAQRDLPPGEKFGLEQMSHSTGLEAEPRIRLILPLGTEQREKRAR